MANDGPVRTLYLFPDDALSVKIACYAGVNAGQAADWWVVVASSYGIISLVLGDHKVADEMADLVNRAAWKPGVHAAYTGPLADFPPLTLFEIAGGLPPDTYRVFFGVDAKANGKLDMDTLIYDHIVIHVVKEADPNWKPDPKEIDDDPLFD